MPKQDDLVRWLRDSVGLPSAHDYAFARLVKRFLLRPGQPMAEKAPVVATVIVPVTNIDHLLREWKIATATANLSGAAGNYVAMFTVPVGKRWQVSLLWRTPTVAVTYPAMVMDGITITLAPNQAASATYNFTDLWAGPGATLGLHTTGDVGDSSELLVITYAEEDAY